jgi:hypothetical protein
VSLTILMRVKPISRLQKGVTYFFVAVISTAHLGSNCFASGGGFEYWTTAGTSFDAGKNWEITVHELLKLGEEAQKFTYHHADLGFVYKGLADWADLGFNYRHIYSRYGSGDWREQMRPHINVTVTGTLGEIDISDRSRIEYRDADYVKDIWWYTNKLTVKLPYKFTKWKLQPCFADQVYINLDGHNYDKNKVYSGFSFEPAKDVRGGLHYVWDSYRFAGRRINTNILWLQLKICF